MKNVCKKGCAQGENSKRFEAGKSFIVGENIKFYRKRMGLTQTQLADKINMSFQAVSKWENGASMPDLLSLYELVRVFNVAYSDILEPQKKREHHMFIGIDGDVAKTEFALFSDNGKIVKCFKKDSASSAVVGLEAAIETLIDGIDECLELSYEVEAIFLGLAGPVRNGQILKIISERYPRIKVFADSNAVNLLSSGSGDTCLICSVGSIVMTRMGNEKYYSGGYGYLFDDEASAFSIGKCAVKAVYEQADGIGERTIISDMMCEKMGVDRCEKIFVTAASEKNVPAYIAGFAKFVFDAYAAGDKVAERILDKNFKTIIERVNALVKKTGASGKVVVGGEVLENNAKTLLPILKKYADRKIEFEFPDLPPVYGACAECMKRMNFEVGESFHDTFKSHYLNLR